MRNERGSMVVEMLYVAPVLLLVVLLISYSGDITETSIKVRAVASVAARRASQASVASMVRVAESSARRDSIDRQLRCHSQSVATSMLASDSTAHVRVTVRCWIRTDTFSLLGVRSRLISATATSPVDRYRRQ